MEPEVQILPESIPLDSTRTLYYLGFSFSSLSIEAKNIVSAGLCKWVACTLDPFKPTQSLSFRFKAFADLPPVV